jgi:hypothetical protein
VTKTTNWQNGLLGDEQKANSKGCQESQGHSIHVMEAPRTGPSMTLNEHRWDGWNYCFLYQQRHQFPMQVCINLHSLVSSSWSWSLSLSTLPSCLHIWHHPHWKCGNVFVSVKYFVCLWKPSTFVHTVSHHLSWGLNNLSILQAGLIGLHLQRHDNCSELTTWLKNSLQLQQICLSVWICLTTTLASLMVRL